jgi:hypothetical protein
VSESTVCLALSLMSETLPSSPLVTRASSPNIAGRTGFLGTWLKSAAIFIAGLALPAYFAWILGPLFFGAPYVDDVDSILNFMLEFREADSVWDKLGLLWKQHNEHRIFTTRLTVVLINLATGTVSFKVTSWVALLVFALIPLFVIWATWRFSDQRSLVTATLAGLVFAAFAFQPRGYEGFFWSTVSVATAYSLLTSCIAAGALFSGATGGILLAAAATWFSMISQGNGLVLLPVFFLMLTLRKEYRRAAIWGALGAVMLGAYFIGFEPPAGHPKVSDSLPHVARNFVYVLTFMGLPFSDGIREAALFAGVAQLSVIVVLFMRRYERENPVIFSMIGVVVASMAVNALSRSEFGLDYPLGQRRYLLMASFLPAFLGAAVVDILMRSKARVLSVTAVTAGALYFCAVSYETYTAPARELSKQVREGLRQWSLTGQGIVYPWADRAESIVGRSIEQAIFDPGPRNRERFFERRRSARGADDLVKAAPSN